MGTAHHPPLVGYVTSQKQRVFPNHRHAFNLNHFPEITDLPDRFSSSAWLFHLPMVPILVKLLRPRTFVELGTQFGDSYLAFCRAVKAAGISTRCTAIDTWQGAENAGTPTEDILRQLRTLHDEPFGTFSRLIQARFDQAAPSFPPKSIDLLHIDGGHSYEEVKADVDTWFPKLSDRGVVLFHDTVERMPGFGVWKLWDEVRAHRPHISVPYGHGLRVLAVGSEVPAEFLEFLDEYNNNPTLVRLLHALGQRAEIIRNCMAAVQSLHIAQAAVNDWLVRTGQPIRNPTPNLAYAWQAAAFYGPVTAQGVQRLSTDAAGLLMEVKQLRERLGQPQ